MCIRPSIKKQTVCGQCSHLASHLYVPHLSPPSYLQLEHIVLQLPLELQEAADGQLPLEVGAEEVGGEGGAAARRLQGVARGGAVPVSHAHAGLGADDALDLGGGGDGGDGVVE